jgi:hypothetical protein
MDRQQAALLGIMSAAFLVMVGVAVFFSNMEGTRGGLSSSPIAPDGPLKKLRAKPGTQRENARALLSSREEAPEDPLAPAYDGETKIWGSLEGEGSGRTRSSDASLTQAAPGDALQWALEALESNREVSLAERHAAVGFALARQYPVDLEAIEAAFANARGHVKSEGQRQAVVYFLCKAYLELGDDAALSQVLSEVPPERLLPDARSLEIGMIQAIAAERAGQPELAEVAYAWVLEAARGWALLGDSRAEGVFRQAARRLAHLYREQGDEERAFTTAQRMRLALALKAAAPSGAESSTRARSAAR